MYYFPLSKKRIYTFSLSSRNEIQNDIDEKQISYHSSLHKNYSSDIKIKVRSDKSLQYSLTELVRLTPS